jgi:hypothetical protein
MLMQARLLSQMASLRRQCLLPKRRTKVCHAYCAIALTRAEEVAQLKMHRRIDAPCTDASQKYRRRRFDARQSSMRVRCAGLRTSYTSNRCYLRAYLSPESPTSRLYTIVNSDEGVNDVGTSKRPFINSPVMDNYFWRSTIKCNATHEYLS